MDEMPPIKPPANPNAPPVLLQEKTISQGEASGSVKPIVRPSGVPYARTPARRAITRYAFEFFQDQIESLRRFSLEEKVRGERGSISGMVREALDTYIAKRNRTEG